MIVRLHEAIKADRVRSDSYDDTDPDVTTASKIRRRLLRGEAVNQAGLENLYGISRTYFAGIRRELTAAGFVFGTEDGADVPATEKRWFLMNPDHEVPENYQRAKTTRKTRKTRKVKTVKTTAVAKPVRKKLAPLVPGDTLEVRGVRRDDDDQLLIEVRNSEGTYVCTVENFKASQ